MNFGGPIGSLPRASSHNFSQVPQADIQRSQFNRSSNYKTTMDSGYLVPCYWDEVLPGDTFNLSATVFARMATPIVPVMDNLYADFFFFFVPYRLLWSNFKKFMGEQASPGDSTSYLTPIITSTAVTGYTIGSIYDYFGLPTDIPGLPHRADPLRAYNLIYNEWFKDQNLQNAVAVNVGDGPDAPTDYTLLRRGKRHDYFTSCLPWPQKGTAVSLPLGTSAPITSNFGAADAQGRRLIAPVAMGSAAGAAPIQMEAGAAGIPVQFVSNFGAGNDLGWALPTDTAYNYADLSNATAATINSLRQAFQIQRLLERDARGGTRYTEIVRSHFGVVSPDARLQRPEYLGGGSRPITMNPIPQTSSTGATGTPQGNLAAMGIFSGSGLGFTKSFTEHGVIIGIVSIRADLNYQQGLNRAWSRRTRYDFYWPALSHLGEQAVLEKEIYAVGTGGATDDNVFGYQERYAEYRYRPNVITGKFRSTASGTLDVWHLAQKFTSAPALDATFIVENPPVSRIVAVNTEPQFLVDIAFQNITARPMPTYSVPGLIDHF